MRAAVITELGAPPAGAEHPAPSRGPGQTLLEVAAAPLNPVDIAVGSGTVLRRQPRAALRSLRRGGRPGCRVGCLRDRSPGLRRHGGDGAAPRRGRRRARRRPRTDGSVELPADADPAVAASLGVAGLAAWLPLSWRAPVEQGETVLVLGATGTLGLIAVQAARRYSAPAASSQPVADRKGWLERPRAARTRPCRSTRSARMRRRRSPAVSPRPAAETGRRSSSTRCGESHSSPPSKRPRRAHGSSSLASRRGPSRSWPPGSCVGRPSTFSVSRTSACHAT